MTPPQLPLSQRESLLADCTQLPPPTIFPLLFSSLCPLFPFSFPLCPPQPTGSYRSRQPGTCGGGPSGSGDGHVVLVTRQHGLHVAPWARGAVSSAALPMASIGQRRDRTMVQFVTHHFQMCCQSLVYLLGSKRCRAQHRTEDNREQCFPAPGLVCLVGPGGLGTLAHSRMSPSALGQ